MTLLQADVYCGCRTTRYQIAMGIAASVLAVAPLVFLAVLWRQIPDRIPTNYDFSGEITGYGGKGSLWILPIIGVFSDALLALMWFFPQGWNTGVQITPETRGYVFRVIRDMMVELRLALALLFVGITVEMVRFSRKLPGWTILVLMVPLFAVTVRGIIRLSRAK